MPEIEKVAYFNKCVYCISYDTQTAYAAISSLLGCIAIVVPEPGKTEADYRKGDAPHYGVAYGFDKSEIDFAVSTRDKLIERFKSFDEINKKNAEYFIKECHNYFFERENLLNV